jgi:hypothetical protein
VATGQPYSVRFMSGRGGNRRETYTVPAGRRAVVLHVTISTWDVPTLTAILRLHGIPVWSLSNPGAFVATFRPVRWTLYQRETIVMEVFGADASYAVDGFLFTDTQEEPDDADNTIEPVVRAESKPVE